MWIEGYVEKWPVCNVDSRDDTRPTNSQESLIPIKQTRRIVGNYPGLASYTLVSFAHECRSRVEASEDCSKGLS